MGAIEAWAWSVARDPKLDCHVVTKVTSSSEGCGGMVGALAGEKQFVIDNGSVLRIGAHMSVAGGVARAVDRAVLHGCEALQNCSAGSFTLAPARQAAKTTRCG
jgi:hypothetical protein